MGICEGSRVKKKSSKELLAEALLHLSESAPVDKITVKQLVIESGVSLQTFYNHFKDKNDLILWIHKSVYEDLFERMLRGEISRDEMLKEYVSYYMAHKKFMLNAFYNTMSTGSIVRNISDHAYDLYEDFLIKKEKIETLPEDISFLLRMYCSTGTLALVKCIELYPDIAEEKVVDYLKEIIPKKLLEYILK